MINYPLVDVITCTVSATSPEYVFEIRLNDAGLRHLKNYHLLRGVVSIPKNKYRFLNDLAAALTEEIVKHLEEMTE